MVSWSAPGGGGTCRPLGRGARPSAHRGVRMSAPRSTFPIMTNAPDLTWRTVAAVRTELADQLASVPDEAWDTPSLCTGWRVRDVVAHMTLPERFSGSLGPLIRAGFSLQRVIRDDAVTRGSAPVADVLAAFRAGIERRTTPPGRRPQHVLDDTYVHARDIRRPLDLAAPPGSPTLDMDVLTDILATLATDRSLGVARRVTGLRLAATDVDWAHGAGAEVAGPAEALVLAMTGRPAGLAELTGPGLATLTDRLG